MDELKLCLFCGDTEALQFENMNFCPNCGADMREAAHGQENISK